MFRYPLVSLSAAGYDSKYRLNDVFTALSHPVAVAQGRFPPALPLLDWTPDQIPSLLFFYDNRTAVDGTMSTVPDRSAAARLLSTNATVSRQPAGYPRHWEMNGQPVLAFNGVASQYAQDTAGDALVYAKRLHEPGVAFAIKFCVLSDGQIFGTWTVASSNMNAVSLYATAIGAGNTGTLSWAVTSTPGVVHLNVSTPAGWVRPGDVVYASLIHNADRTYAVKFVREPRYPGDVGATFTASGTATGTVNTGNASYGITLGARSDLAASTSVRIYGALAALTGATTASDFAKLEAAWSAATSFSFLAFDVDSPILIANMGDGTHGNVAYHAQCGMAFRQLEALCATDLGITSGTVRVGVIGDSRPQGTGTGVVLGVSDMRAVAQMGVFPYTRQAVGPLDDGSGTASKLHFARSGYVTRTNGGSSGHSQRSPSASTVDNYWGAGKAFNDTQIVSWLLGVNDLSRPAERDYVDEWVRIVEYMRTSAVAATLPPAAHSLLNEPITGSTTNGTLQYLIRSRNRAYHSAVRYLRTLVPVRMANLNDLTYNP